MELAREIIELKKIASLYKRRGRLTLALEVLRTALGIETGLYGQDSLPAAYTLYQIGETLCDAGQYAEARPYFEKAVDIWQMRHPNDLEAAIGFSNALTRLQEAAAHEQGNQFYEDEDQENAA